MSFTSLSYFEKWLVLGLLIGIAAGASATVFYFSIRFFEQVLLGTLVGASVPHPVGEGGTLTFSYFVRRPYLVPVSVAVGGLASGLLVYGFAPEAEGHGTDMAIDAYHNAQGKIRGRIPIIKMIASSVVIGSGGSAGREGPTAQMSAGVGSILADFLRLSPSDRRMAVAVGIGAGIGTIFKAPIGGAVLAAEVLYRRDLEPEVIFPAIVASSVGYSMFASIVGFEPIFGSFVQPFSAYRLPLYAVLGIAAGFLAVGYVRVFYAINALFKRIAVSRYVKPAIGGAVTGALALLFPEVLGTGYGWIQLMIGGNYTAIVGAGLPLLVLLGVLPIVKIFATSMTVGSGGSGGVFAPGMVIGASLGAFFGVLFHILLPAIVPSPAPFVIVGMLSFFGAAGKVPLSVILMVVEMTGSLQLLPAAMLATALSYTVSGLRYSIYKSQVNTRKDSPAHMGEYNTPLLASIRISEVNIRGVAVSPDEAIGRAKDLMRELSLASLPVVREGRFLGTVYLFELENVQDGTVGAFVKAGSAYVRTDATAEDAWDVMMQNKTLWCPVLDKGKYLGMVTLGDLLESYRAKEAALRGSSS